MIRRVREFMGRGAECRRQRDTAIELAAHRGKQVIDLQAEVARARESERSATSELLEVLDRGADPTIKSALLSIKGMGVADAGDDLCFIGPTGCQSHPEWAMKSGECGKAWVRSWLRQSSSDPGMMVVFHLLSDEEPNEARRILRDALEMFITVRGYDSAGVTRTLWAGIG